VDWYRPIPNLLTFGIPHVPVVIGVWVCRRYRNLVFDAFLNPGFLDETMPVKLSAIEVEFADSSFIAGCNAQIPLPGRTVDWYASPLLGADA
jgi:hypothetical protein